MAYTSVGISKEKLRALIDAKFHGSVAFFSRRVGVEPQTGWKWLKKGRMDPELLEKAASELGVSPDELRTTNGNHDLDLPPGIDPDAISVAAVPTWEVDVSASAWVQIPVCELDTNDPEQMRVIKTGRFRLRIIGHCMEPAYQSGSVVEFEIAVIDRDPMIVGVDYVVCRSDGTGTFKQLVQIAEDTITLAARNQKDYPGVLVVDKQEVVRVARVAHRLMPPPDPTLPKIRIPR